MFPPSIITLRTISIPNSRTTNMQFSSHLNLNKSPPSLPSPSLFPLVRDTTNGTQTLHVRAHAHEPSTHALMFLKSKYVLTKCVSAAVRVPSYTYEYTSSCVHGYTSFKSLSFRLFSTVQLHNAHMLGIIEQVQDYEV